MKSRLTAGKTGKAIGLSLALALALMPLAGCSTSAPEGQKDPSSEGRPAPSLDDLDYEAINSLMDIASAVYLEHDIGFGEAYSFEFDGYIVTLGPKEPTPFQEYDSLYPGSGIRVSIPGYKIVGVDIGTKEWPLRLTLAYPEEFAADYPDVELGVVYSRDLSNPTKLAMQYAKDNAEVPTLTMTISYDQESFDEMAARQTLKQLDAEQLGSPDYWIDQIVPASNPLTVVYHVEGLTIVFMFTEGPAWQDEAYEQQVFDWLRALDVPNDLDYYRSLL